MKISFVAGFGPLVRDADESLAWWGEKGLGIEFDEVGPGYFATNKLPGVKHLGLWPLSEAAENTFGTREWPQDIPTPSAGIEFDVESHAAVGEAVAELEGKGFRVLRGAKMEDWGQTTARLLSPEGLLVGISHTPWMHPPGTEAAD